MNIPTRTNIRAAMAALFCSLFLIAAGTGFGQSGPPPFPPNPVNSLMAYPLDAPPWNDWFGDPARGFTNLNVADIRDSGGPALSVDTNTPAFLNYDVYQDGYTNIVFDSGSISLWCQANWTSTTDGGTGPTNWAVLLSVGNWTSNAAQSAWVLAISPDGTNLVMEAQSAGSNQVVFNVPIDFDAGDWHSVTVTYSSSNCCLFLEGQFVTNTQPISNFPSPTDCTNYGMFVGSLSTAGISQFHGQFQWFDTYDYPLSTNEVVSDYAEVSSYIAYYGGSLPNIGVGIGGGGFHPGDDVPTPGGGDYSTNGGSYTNYVSYTPWTPPAAISPLDYAAYSQFYLTITNNGTNIYVAVQNCLSNLTYLIFTNANLANPSGWSLWRTNLALGSVLTNPPLSLNSNAMFFSAQLVFSTTTNGLPDFWSMEYFNTLNVNPYADPDGDGLCNLDEYVLGLNPTNAHTLSSLHTDAQAWVLAYTNDPACKHQLFVTNAPGNTNVLLVSYSNTLVGSNYQIYSQVVSATNGPWIVETNFLGTNTATTVAICLNGRTLSLIGGYGEDSDGDGLPDGYEVLATLTDPYLPDTGLTGIGDAYKDPDGDGYVNIVEYYNGTDPHVFNAPVGPINVIVDPGTTTNTYNISWQQAAGAVTGYIISGYNYTSSTWVTLATNSPTQLTYVLEDASQYNGGNGIGAVNVTVQAVYAGGTSSANPAPTSGRPAMAQAVLVHGPGGRTYLLTSAANSNLIGCAVTMSVGSEFYPRNPLYYQSVEWYSTTNPSPFFVPASQFTNGIALLTTNQAPPNVQLTATVTPQMPGDGNWGMDTFAESQWTDLFFDTTTEMKQNIRFLLRAANASPFGYTMNSDEYGSYSFLYPTNYVYSSVYAVNPYGSSTPYPGEPYSNHWLPLEENYFFANFVFNSSLIDGDGNLDTGFDTWSFSNYYYQTNNTQFQFPTYNYVASSNEASNPGLLSSSQTPWVGYFQGDPDDFGAYSSGSSLAMSSGNVNIYGLPYNSLELTLSNSAIEFATLSPGNNVSGYSNLPFYSGTPQPELETVSYYFVNAAVSPFPGYQDGSFSTTNTTPSLIIGSVGNNLYIAGYAKQAVLNGYGDVFAYLGQYFTNAFTASNETVTTNLTGVLSEFGEFFPTAPGQVALVTMPDPDQANRQGTNFLDIIRLSLDVNHDGIMDETFTGPDNTSFNVYFEFWANNNYDRWTTDTLDYGVEFEDDVESNSYPGSSLETGLPVPDYGYCDLNGHRIIPCPRDLEDFARLWVSGVSNTLSRLPSGSTVTLSWAGIGTSPTIDLFQAADADGGIGYQTNLTTASNQINTNLCRYIGRLSPGGSIQLNASTFSNNWAGDHYIWCGVWGGSDQLNLTISNTTDGTVLAQSSQYIQIVDIKQMYERWTVGDNDNNNPLATVVPMSNAVPAEDNFSPGYPSTPFQYSYDPAIDTNDNYILYVHGWNESTWLKDRWAETAYKRLYWQGYQGRFGEFRWPCFSLSADLSTYDTSEWNAWKSGQSLETFLASWLNKSYPNHVYVTAHSQGNVVVSEALRLAGTNQIVNTYVASQAALSARAYDNTVATNAAAYYTLTTSDPQGHYYTNGAPSYFSASAGAGKYVNFYNPNDYALMGDSINPLSFHPGWLEDQSLKPDSVEFYHYATPTVSIPSGYYLQGSAYNRTGVPSTIYPLYFPTNTYQIVAMGAQSYSLALGTQVGVNGSFVTRQVNLSASPYSFGSEHIGHDSQFVFDNMTTAAYWQQLLVSFQLQPTP